MSAKTNTSKTERELVAVCRRIDEAARLVDKKVHLFIELRDAGVTQARIGELSGMSDVGVMLAIRRHHARHAKGLAALAAARNDAERSEAEALICQYCADEAAADVQEPVTADA